MTTPRHLYVLFGLILLLPQSGAAQSLGQLRELIEGLVEIPAISGHESQLADAIAPRLRRRGLSPDIDRMSNVTVTVGSGRPRRLIVAKSVGSDLSREDVQHSGGRPCVRNTFVSSDPPPGEDKRFVDAPLGSGLVIRVLDTSNLTPIEFVDRVIRIANQHNVPVQVGSTNGGNDGSTFTRYGAIDIPIAWPLRYSHSPVEVLEQTDLEALADVIRHLVSEF